jgi:hypothetical protein
MPWDVSATTWKRIIEKNARDAWRYWINVKAPKAWLDAFNGKSPWKAGKTKAEIYRIRYHNDPEFRLKEILRNYDRKAQMGRFGEALRSAIKSGSEYCRVSNGVGYTISELKRHLERQFTEGMTWEKFANGEIHIDHIVPLSSFDLSSRREFWAAWSLTNLRPLLASENLAKSSKRTHLL